MAHFQSIPQDTVPIPVNGEGSNKFMVYALNKEEEEANKVTEISALNIDEERTHSVDWPAQNKWNDTDNATRGQVHVRRYELRDDGYFFTYRLTFFTNTPGHYIFWDESGDYYTKSVLDISRDHSIDYNSRAGKIVRVFWKSLA